jgi:hypothetical protein
MDKMEIWCLMQIIKSNLKICAVGIGFPYQVEIEMYVLLNSYDDL